MLLSGRFFRAVHAGIPQSLSMKYFKNLGAKNVFSFFFVIFLAGIIAGCGGGEGGDSGTQDPDRLDIQGVAATGQAVPEGSEVCAQAWSSQTIETILDCTITDARGGFLIENLQDKIDSVKSKLLILKVIFDDPVKGVQELYSINYQTGTEIRTANINELTDLKTRIAINEATNGRITDPDVCWVDNSCVDDLQNEAFQDASFIGDIGRSTDAFFGMLATPGRDPVTDYYVADPKLDELDALQERVDFNYNLVDGSVDVTNRNGVVIGSAKLHQLQQSDLNSEVDIIDNAEALDAINLAGGFGTDGNDGSPRQMCWKSFRSGPVLALVESICTNGIAECDQAGGNAAETPHESATDCASSCARNASPPFDISFATSELNGSNAQYFRSTCLSQSESFNSAASVEPLNAEQACSAGLQSACESGEAADRPMNLTCDVSGSNYIALNWDAVVGADSYYIYHAINDIPDLTSDPYAATNALSMSENDLMDGEHNWVVTALSNSESTSIESLPSDMITCNIKNDLPSEPGTFLQAIFNGQTIDFPIWAGDVHGKFSMDDSDTSQSWVTINDIFDYHSIGISFPARTTGTYTNCDKYYLNAGVDPADAVRSYTEDGSSVCSVTLTTEVLSPTSPYYTLTNNRRTRGVYSFTLVSYPDGITRTFSSLTGDFAFIWDQKW